jgi:hypothetical protein
MGFSEGTYYGGRLNGEVVQKTKAASPG